MSNEAEQKMKIPTEYLPKGWKKAGAELFGLEEETIRKIVTGQRNNKEVFGYFLELARQGKAEELSRIEALNQLTA